MAKFKIEEGIEFPDGTSQTTASGGGGAANVGDFTFTNATMSAPDGDTIRIENKDNNTVRTYIQMDPADDIIGMYNDNTYYNSISYNFSVANANFVSAVWQNEGSAGKIVISGATSEVQQSIQNLTNISYISVDDGLTTYTLTANGNTGTPSLPADQDFGVTTQPPGGTPLQIVSMYIEIRIQFRTNIEIDGPDININARDDIRIRGRDTFQLRNVSTSASIDLVTQYGSINEKAYRFGADGNLRLPANSALIGQTRPDTKIYDIVSIALETPFTNPIITVNEPLESPKFYPGMLVDIRYAGDATNQYYIDFQSTSTFRLFSDPGLTQAVDASTWAPYTTGGEVWVFADLGNISIMPNTNDGFHDYLANGQFINIYPTNANDVPHIHIAAGKGTTSTGDLILGDDRSHIDVNHGGFIDVKTYNNSTSAYHYWTFGTDGKLQIPQGGDIVDSNSNSLLAKEILSENNTVGAGVAGTIWTDSNATNTTAKLLVNGVDTNGDSQSCEVLITKKSNNTVTETVYANVHSTTNPMFTVAAGWNATTNRMILDATVPGANNIAFKVKAITM